MDLRLCSPIHVLLRFQSPSGRRAQPTSPADLMGVLCTVTQGLLIQRSRNFYHIRRTAAMLEVLERTVSVSERPLRVRESDLEHYYFTFMLRVVLGTQA